MKPGANKSVGLATLVEAGRLRGEETDSWAKNVRCRPVELAISLRQLSTLVLAGTHITKAIKVVGEQCSSPVLVEVWWTVEQSIHDGYPLSRSMERFPQIFGRLVTTLIRVGESSGSLPLCLEQIANWLERDYRLAANLRSSMTYPAFVLVFSGLLTWWLFTTVLPPFLAVLAQTGVTLPWPTRLLSLVVRVLDSPLGWAMVLVVLGGGYQFRQWTLRPEGKARFLTVLHRLPISGPYLLFSANVRTALAASILLKTGCDSITTWKLALQACDDPVVGRHLKGLILSIREGEQPSEYFSRFPDHFLPVFGQMVKGGEETGRLPRFLEGLSRLLEEELEHRMGLLLSVLEPLVMILLSALMLLVLLAVFLPLYSHLSSLSA